LTTGRARLHLPGHGAEVASEPEKQAVVPPEHWTKGQLLNVRNTGNSYTVTQYPEEFDYQRPERALMFANPAELQDFISHWYAREHFDPRAF
jgi:hypothetical protein